MLNEFLNNTTYYQILFRLNTFSMFLNYSLVLIYNNITLNKNAIPGDPASPSITSGVRIGTAAVTTRGLKAEDMPAIAHCIALTAKDFAGTSTEVKATVAEICAKYPLY